MEVVDLDFCVTFGRHDLLHHSPTAGLHSTAAVDMVPRSIYGDRYRIPSTANWTIGRGYSETVPEHLLFPLMDLVDLLNRAVHETEVGLLLHQNNQTLARVAMPNPASNTAPTKIASTANIARPCLFSASVCITCSFSLGLSCWPLS